MADGLLNKASIILTPTGYKAGTLYNVAPVVEPYEDFDFARASVASRVNSSGLVEMVGRTLSSELVTDGDFTLTGTQAADTTGTYWTTADSWTISNNKSSYNGTTNGSILEQAVTLNNGSTYEVELTISDNSGRFRLSIDSGTPDYNTYTTGNGTYKFYFVANADELQIRGSLSDSADTFSVTNVSLKEVIDTNNIPRISYDSNGENGHILLEPTSTNLVTYSEDFTQGWSDFNVGFTSGFYSPDGTKNATLLSGNGISSFPNIKDTLSSSGDVSFSVFVKKELSDTIALRVEGTGIGVGLGTNSIYTYTFSTNSFSNVSGEDASGFDSEPFSNDWIRLQINYTSTTITACRIYPAYNVANSEGVYIWGAQLEELSYATSYIPTLTGSQEVRATETATGAGSADLINSTEGVLYAEIAALADDLSNRMIALSDSDSTDHVRIYYTNSTNKISVAVKSNGSNQYIFLNHNVTDITDYIKIAVKYKANNFATFINGVKVNSQTTTASAPIGLDRLNFDSGAGVSDFYGKCKALAVFNEALEDDELSQLTTL